MIWCTSCRASPQWPNIVWRLSSVTATPALAVARCGTDPAVVGRYVDWELMEARWWHNTPQEPDRMERRMAEWLAHRHVPWSAIIGVAARTEERSRQASAALATVGATTIVRSRPEWYF